MNETLSLLPASGSLSIDEECEVILKVGDVVSILNTIINRVSDEA
jgi:hypothetical protein